MGKGIERFYLTEGIIDPLRQPLESKLVDEGYKDVRTLDGERPASPCVAVIHESELSSETKFTRVKEWVQEAHFDLVVFLVQGAGEPREYVESEDENIEIDMGTTVCRCGTQHLIQNLDLLEEHLKSEDPKDWNCTDWIAPEPEYLPALSILCQGYLAVHAEDHGTQENVEVALEQMGWSDDLIPDYVDVRAKKHEVADPEEEYWQAFGGTEWIDQVKEEWERDSVDRWGDVESLLNDIKEDRSLQPEIVASAYCALVKRLGGEPCQ